MEKFNHFLIILAWVVACICTFFSIFAIYKQVTYPGSIEEIRDLSRGQIGSYPVWPWLFLAIVAWIFIIA